MYSPGGGPSPRRRRHIRPSMPLKFRDAEVVSASLVPVRNQSGSTRKMPMGGAIEFVDNANSSQSQ